LQEIVRQRARVAILDISGVPTVDTAVAKHLSETIAAARLLGVCVIVSGISPRVARTLVELGVEWEGVQTVHNLGQAMEMAQEALR
jgi:rsbT co-antagonist protein RsbR